MFLRLEMVISHRRFGEVPTETYQVIDKNTITASDKIHICVISNKSSMYDQPRTKPET